ncbi:hypothetical protein [Sinorhizobium americanum]|uniref:Transmembrane protein n=1 Tax=Sinorhizobium americanum TaxID=194963 RepID=A0A4R2ATU6_9HYPH|nr:hypothetical protein [Sinorhizobium americanum]TCN17297.1 hypothetical protein EV184_13928 [Sinorhizobium americanum]
MELRRLNGFGVYIFRDDCSFRSSKALVAVILWIVRQIGITGCALLFILAFYEGVPGIRDVPFVDRVPFVREFIVGRVKLGAGKAAAAATEVLVARSELEATPLPPISATSPSPQIMTALPKGGAPIGKAVIAAVGRPAAPKGRRDLASDRENGGLGIPARFQATARLDRGNADKATWRS